jgi:hypothetical protein
LQSIATFIIVAYYIVSGTYHVESYNRWAVLALDIFGVIFWLISFALLADWSANAYSGSYWYGYAYDPWPYGAPYQVDRRSLVKHDPSGKYSASRGLAAASAAGGAVEL